MDRIFRCGHVAEGDNLYISPKGVKICRTCQRARDIKKRVDRPNYHRNQLRDWKMRNKEHVVRYQKNYDLMRNYGLTLEEFENKRIAQNNQCAICKIIMSAPRVDHNHQTGEIRDLLCDTCNVGIGMLQDNVLVIEAAAAYLRRWKEEA